MTNVTFRLKFLQSGTAVHIYS